MDEARMDPTFKLLDADEARAEFDSMSALATVEQMPNVTGFSLIARCMTDASAIVSAEDTANGCARVYELPDAFVKSCGAEQTAEVFEERVVDHLDRLAKAVFN